MRRNTENLIEAFTYSPEKTLGATNSTLSTGRYQISRSGSVVTAYYAGLGSSDFTQVASITYSTEPMLLELCGVQGGSGGPRSLTPMDISFDNLTIVADQIQGIPEPSTFVLFGMGEISLLVYTWQRRRALQ